MGKQRDLTADEIRELAQDPANHMEQDMWTQEDPTPPYDLRVCANVPPFPQRVQNTSSFFWYVFRMDESTGDSWDVLRDGSLWIAQQTVKNEKTDTVEIHHTRIPKGSWICVEEVRESQDPDHEVG